MDEFIQLIRDLMQEVEENIDEFDDEELEAIHLFIQKALAFIQQEAGQSQQAAPLEAAQVPTAPYPSSNIFGFNYNPEDKKLMIKFMGKDIADGGPVYSYDGVPPYMFDIIKRGAVAPKTSGKNKYHEWYKGKTPSHGASVYALIKQGGFPYQQVA